MADDITGPLEVIEVEEEWTNGYNKKAVGWADDVQDLEAPTIIDRTHQHMPVDLDDSSLLSLIPEDFEGERYHPGEGALLKQDLHNIPGSPWAKPAGRFSRRLTEPLKLSSYASQFGLLAAFGWVVYLFIVAVW
jgi:hypothetical protein